MSVCAAAIPATSIPAARLVPAPGRNPNSADATIAAGRHRRALTVSAQLHRATDVVARVGSLVTLTSLLVVAAAVGGAFDSAPAGPPTVTAVFSGSGH